MPLKFKIVFDKFYERRDEFIQQADVQDFPVRHISIILVLRVFQLP